MLELDSDINVRAHLLVLKINDAQRNHTVQSVIFCESRNNVERTRTYLSVDLTSQP